ncbi:sigma-70 family RNA polymerase sigma factor [Aeromicrobium sp. SMF47]|uniref:Sigma-70 family RNA polymerase sigma factor n=1 Tax=Aeromicrobium yanjiei TaxID=2662028 RepID=A0A5Q2MKT8_9ACTN|nr:MULTISPECIES: RNA polymerase sigma factor [Aeromicrobium]MRJ76428.1 sigma-70 family RNA polymerase sigma factor [Aeromicrobium yanjiei]MRK00779.1 sigma-70 family RNA polymerase sigma factor [Aeromicrobium sp. S22]QGG42401.1 sigma-70 family RNA polymerase sigma factor [Aeromicrobium yanjiei]
MTAPPTTEHGTAATDRDLLVRAAAGDRGAFGLLYDRHVRPVYWQAYAVVHDADEAQDVTQDVFITMWRKIRTITVVDESVLPWLLVTSRFTALNAGRRRMRTPFRELDPEAPADMTVEDEVEAGLVRAEIDKAAAALTPADRRLYELCVEGDHTYEMAARELGVSHAAVRNRLSRLRTRLRADLRSMRETS